MTLEAMQFNREAAYRDLLDAHYTIEKVDKGTALCKQYCDLMKQKNCEVGYWEALISGKPNEAECIIYGVQPAYDYYANRGE